MRPIIELTLTFTRKWVVDRIDGLIVSKSRPVVLLGQDGSDHEVLHVHGSQAHEGKYTSINSLRGRVFSGDMPLLFEYWNRTHKPLTLEVSIQCAAIKIPSIKDSEGNHHVSTSWYNTFIECSWIGSAGMRTGTIPFSAKWTGNDIIVNQPQWMIEKNYIPIISGSLVETMKGMVEAEYRRQCDELGIGLPEPIHQAFCTNCHWFRSEGYDRGLTDDEKVTRSCDLGVFLPFCVETDTTVEERERVGINADWTSSEADGTYVWIEPDGPERALTAAEWVEIGILIDADDHQHHRGFENRFASFERLYDDLFWIERLQDRLHEIDDLDKLINEERTAFMMRAAALWARKLPEYAELFMKQSHPKTADVTAAEVTEVHSKVSVNAFMNTHLLRPCAYGITWKGGKEGIRCYRNKGYDIPDTDAPEDVIKRFKASINSD